MLCDTKGVIYQGRTDGMNQWKSAHAVETKARTLAEAMDGADVFFGLSVKGAVTRRWSRAMADKPIIFAMANPDPEITPEEARAGRPDAIIATGRSDYPNQVNNVLGFPYIFRGALDVRATHDQRRDEDRRGRGAGQAGARGRAGRGAFRLSAGRRLTFGPEYIIPTPFDPRLISAVPPAVARAAMESGVARKPIVDMRRYARSCRAGSIRPPARSSDHGEGARQSEARRLRRGRGGEDDPRRRRLSAMPVTARPVLIGREDRVQRDDGEPRAWHRRRASKSTTRGCRSDNQQIRRVPLWPPAAPRHAAPRLPAPGEPGPQRVRRLHGRVRRCRCDGDRVDRARLRCASTTSAM